MNNKFFICISMIVYKILPNYYHKFFNVETYLFIPIVDNSYILFIYFIANYSTFLFFSVLPLLRNI